MPYLKSSPYIMTVDSLHSMGYPGKFQPTKKLHPFKKILFGVVHECRIVNRDRKFTDNGREDNFL